jgi:hypothetical protein
VQQLQVTTNATGGYNVYMRSAATTTNVMKGSGSNVITDSGAVALPSAGTSFFGYTSDQTASAITSGEVRTVPVSPGGAAVVGYRSAGSASATNNCVGYGVSASGATAADSYSTTILYTAVPNY